MISPGPLLLGTYGGTKVDGVITEKYLWQGFTRLLAVEDVANSILTRFEYADARMPVAMTRGGQTYYLSYDQVGSLRLVADASGSVVKMVKYDSFGNILTDSNPALDMPLGFAGGLHDRDTGLAKFGFRDYDPEVGRWTAKDPILFAGGEVDFFGYVLNNPVNLTDPSGLLGFFWHFGLTYFAARNSGYGIWDSLALAWKVTAIDFDGSTTEKDVASACQHGMGGELPPGVFQNPEQAIASTTDYIQSSIGNNPPGAIHAAQDLPGHAGESMEGFGWNWKTINHVLGDIFPSRNTIAEAYQSTRGYLSK